MLTKFTIYFIPRCPASVVATRAETPLYHYYSLEVLIPQALRVFLSLRLFCSYSNAVQAIASKMIQIVNMKSHAMYRMMSFLISFRPDFPFTKTMQDRAIVTIAIYRMMSVSMTSSVPYPSFKVPVFFKCKYVKTTFINL